MAKDLEYFDEFFAAPEAMKARVFYSYVHEWLAYLKEHEGEFNYLEDEEWRERKDRVLAVLTEQEDLKDEFAEIEEKLDSINEFESGVEKIAVYEEWLAFIKRNRRNYDVSEKDLAEMEREIKEAVIAVLDCEVLEERLKRRKAKYQKSIAELDETLSAHYTRTGKRLVLTSLAFKFGKRLKGN
jgi:DNA repair ATPase RecN